jgi:UDP-GlcNAc:undecaprenyl-phosphate/decaprenyl-phosphate GlcNAc-1-phosphate transferase
VSVIPPALASFALAAAVGSSAAVACRAVARRFGIVSHPNPLVPQHRAPVAYLGGVAVFAGMAAGAAIHSHVPGGRGSTDFATAAPFWLGAVCFLVFGLLDDLFTSAPLRKFCGQLVIAAGFVAAAGAPALTGTAIDGGLAILWILVLVNAMNVTDVCDGLIAGLAAIMAVGAAWVVPDAAGVMLAVSGSCVGVLALNRPPASMFLGDAGSHLLGFAVAAVQLHGLTSDATLSSAAAFVILPAVVLFELGSLVYIRTNKGLPWWRGSSDHFALRMQRAGCSRWRVDAISWSAGAACAAAAVAVARGSATAVATVILGAVLAALAAFHALNRTDARTGRRQSASEAL